MLTRLSPSSLAEQIAQRSALSPEFWLFNAPASAKEIKRLEARLGRRLPGSLAESLSQANGGFASPDGKIGVDCPQEVATARDRANRFLSCQEIEKAYRDLLGEQVQDDPARFPFIPFMLQAEGDLLAVHAEDPLSAVWQARLPESPHLWRRLYPTLGELLAHYLAEDGAILAEPFDGEPTALPC